MPQVNKTFVVPSRIFSLSLSVSVCLPVSLIAARNHRFFPSLSVRHFTSAYIALRNIASPKPMPCTLVPTKPSHIT